MKETGKYLVIPTKYIDKLTETQKLHLHSIVEAIEDIRNDEGKLDETNYIVCKETEPYASKVWDLILHYNEIDEKMIQAHNMIDLVDTVSGHDIQYSDDAPWQLEVVDINADWS